MPSRSDDDGSLMLQCCAANFVDRVGVTEIDHDIAISHRRFDGITQIALRDDLDIRIALGKSASRTDSSCGEIDNRFTHAPGRTYEQHADGRLLHYCETLTLPTPFARERRRSLHS